MKRDKQNAIMLITKQIGTVIYENLGVSFE